jgi:hypothetical protein
MWAMTPVLISRLEGIMPKEKICGACGGKTRCYNCGGRGRTGTMVTVKCSVCNGKKNCPRCGGTGRVK